MAAKPTDAEYVYYTWVAVFSVSGQHVASEYACLFGVDGVPPIYGDHVQMRLNGTERDARDDEMAHLRECFAQERALQSRRLELEKQRAVAHVDPAGPVQIHLPPASSGTTFKITANNETTTIVVDNNDSIARLPPEEHKTMTDNRLPSEPVNTSIVKTLQHDAGEAAWRTAGSQFVKLTREPLVGLLSRHLGPNDDALRLRIAAFLETDIGTALLASLLSVGLAAIPGVAGEVPQRLTKELRVRAMSDAGGVVADVLMGPLRQVMTMYLQDVTLPTVPASLHAPRVDNAVPFGVRSAEREPVSKG